MRTALAEQIRPSEMILPACTDVEKRPTFSEKVGVHDELVGISVAEGGEKPDGRREGGGKEP